MAGREVEEKVVVDQFFKKGEIIANRNDLVGRERFMIEEGKDIFRAISLIREEGIVYCVKGKAGFSQEHGQKAKNMGTNSRR